MWRVTCGFGFGVGALQTVDATARKEAPTHIPHTRLSSQPTQNKQTKPTQTKQTSLCTRLTICLVCSRATTRPARGRGTPELCRRFEASGHWGVRRRTACALETDAAQTYFVRRCTRTHNTQHTCVRGDAAIAMHSIRRGTKRERRTRERPVCRVVIDRQC
jgi:hypothetical protein